MPFTAAWLCWRRSGREDALERHSWSSWGCLIGRLTPSQEIGHGAGEQHHALSDDLTGRSNPGGRAQVPQGAP